MNDGGRKIDIGGIFTAALNDIGNDVGRYAVFALAWGVVGGLAATYVSRSGNPVATLPLFIISIFVTFHALRAKLGDASVRPRFGSASVYIFLTSLAIGVGLLLLVVPGLILFARWVVGLPALFCEELSVSEALSRSSSLTQGNRWRILGMGLLIWVPFLLVIILTGWLTASFGGGSAIGSLPFNMLTNLIAGCLTILASVCWTEAYLSLSGEEESSDNLAEIFA
jgi:hypothetical protein